MANLRTNNLFGESGQDSNGSAVFDGSNHLTAANATAFRVNQGSSEDFTIEAWIYLTTTPDGANARIASIYHTSGNQRSYMFYVHTDDTLKFNYASSGTAGSVSTLAAGRVPHNQWVHVAVTHDSSATTVRLFNNGVLRATDTGAHATYYANTSGDFTIGEDFTGNISNLHITRGTCKYTGNFIPSKEPIEEDSNTTVLCCNSRFNPLSDDKSNTFTQTSDGAVEASSFIPFDRADSGNIFNGPIKHNTQGYIYFPTGRTVERGRGRALLGGGHDPSGATNHIQQFSIQSQGNTENFGDLTYVRWIPAPSSSSTRGVWSGGGGYNPGSPTGSYVNFIDFVTIATPANATDFGDQTAEKGYHAGFSNETRGIIAGGYNDSVGKIDVIEFITIATAGNAQDFGDLTAARMQLAATGSPTRGLFFGGSANPNVNTNVVDFITIATTGNAQDFGDMTAPTKYGNATSSNTRAIYGGGLAPDATTYTNKIEFFTIASAGNGTDFGDLTTTRSTTPGATSNNIRGIFAGGYVPGNVNSIDFVTIATTGNASDFGDMTSGAIRGIGALSDSHGGLS